MEELKITNDTEFYGFLNDVDVESAAQVAEMLRMPASSKINETDPDDVPGREIVEEVVRRGGTFYTGTESKPIVPWTMVYTDVCTAKFKYLENEERPENPAFADYNWVVLNVGQYMYGKYLQAQIADGNLKITDLK